MLRINSKKDVLSSGRVLVDAGEHIRLDLPVAGAPVAADITSRIPQITRGTLSVTREANKVTFTLYDVRFENETEFPEFFYLDDAIPIGCRPDESYVSFLAMYDVNGAKSRRVRFQKDRKILLYELAVGDRVNLVATFYTDEPPVDTI